MSLFHSCSLLIVIIIIVFLPVARAFPNAPLFRVSTNENAFTCQYQLTFIQCLSPSGHRLRKRRTGVLWRLAGVSSAAGGGGGGGGKTRLHKRHCLCSRTNSRGDVSRCALLLFIYVIIITIIIVCFLVARASVSVTLPFLFIVNNNNCLLASRESISECLLFRISINENAFTCQYQLTFIQCLSPSPSGQRR